MPDEVQPIEMPDAARHDAVLHDPARLSTLRSTGLLDTEPAEVLERLTRIATKLIGVPVALVSLVDHEHQWFAGLTGLTGWAGEQRQTPLSHSFCQHVVASRAELIIGDSHKAALVAGNQAIADLDVRAYAGIPLTTSAGHTLGALCAIDVAPRDWTETEIDGLRDLATAAMSEIELRLAVSARRTSEARLQGIIDSATDAIISTDDTQRIVMANASAEQMFGYPPQALVGQPLDVLIPASLRSVHRGHVTRFGEDGTTSRRMQKSGSSSAHLDLAGQRMDGSQFPLEASISQLETDAGRVFTVILRDITDRKAAAAARDAAVDALRESEVRARILFRDSPLPMWVYDLETLRVKDANLAAQRRYGYTHEEFVQLDVTQMRPWEDRAAFASVLPRRFSGIPYVGTFRHLTKGGEAFDVEVSTQETIYDGRRARIVLANDVTESRRTAEALRISEKRYAMAAKATGHAIWDWDLETGIVSWAEGAHEVLGHDEVQAENSIQWWQEQLHPDDRDRVIAGRLRAIERDAAVNEWHDAYQFRRGDGTYAHLEDRASVERDADGRAVRMIGATEDCTAQRHLESQLRQAQKMEAVGQLAGGVAHDFNNLLTVISGNLEFVRGDLPPDHPVRADLEDIARAADRARVLVRQLLTFSRKQPVQVQNVRLRDVVHGAEQLLRRVIGEEITLEVDIDASTSYVRVDTGHLEQILINLAVNARDAMLTPMHGRRATGGTLSIHADELTLTASSARSWDGIGPGRWVRLRVSDDGHGMDAQTQAHAFEPFFTTKKLGEGTGLGLATVFGIVRQAGGVIRTDSTPGEGTTFTILLPLVPEEALRDEPLPSLRAPAHVVPSTI
ncbi:MAG TPA: PAS domain S-box protein, partial [Gemmatimonadaceae bacterium]|nr:PAS domain S-box protein [Gemmatimonadaceae bacterium]